jgi:hypothetical protein
LDLQPNGKIRISNTNSIEHIFYKSFLYDWNDILYYFQFEGWKYLICTVVNLF